MITAWQDSVLVMVIILLENAAFTSNYFRGYLNSGFGYLYNEEIWCFNLSL